MSCLKYLNDHIVSLILASFIYNDYLYFKNDQILSLIYYEYNCFLCLKNFDFITNYNLNYLSHFISDVNNQNEQ